MNGSASSRARNAIRDTIRRTAFSNRDSGLLVMLFCRNKMSGMSIKYYDKQLRIRIENRLQSHGIS